MSTKLSGMVLAALLAIEGTTAEKKMPASIEASAPEPVIYTGTIQPDKRYYDGRLPHAVGVHQYQAFRANRTHPSEPGTVGWTYNHQPYLAYWKGKFYLQYLSGLFQEHTPPTRTLLATSDDGMRWSAPVIAFPEYELPRIESEGAVIPAGTKSVMHQRMGFYAAPDGRLLTLAFYGYSATPRNSPNAGNGLGRVVREVYADGRMGPIYFIRYNRHAGWDEKNTRLPFYRTSPDAGFVRACDALLADKLMTLQWWEEDRANDGFFTMRPDEVAGAAYFSSTVTTSGGAGKAFCFYTRPDGVVVGLWKNQYSALSPDRGKTWTRVAMNKTLWTTGAKTWGQRTEDGRYVVVHNQSPTRRNRFPMVALVGEDGHLFDRMLCLRGEVPEVRYQGIHKNPGPQYYRGIEEGNGDPPGPQVWLTYSVNKEDIWVSRVAVPIAGSVDREVNDDFNQVQSIQDLGDWNLYVPRWAPISLVAGGEAGSRCLELRDEEPYDYALAERVFPRGARKEIEFSLRAAALTQGHALEIEVQDQRGARPIKLRLDRDWLSFDIKKTAVPDPVRAEPGKWLKIKLRIDADAGSYDCALDGTWVRRRIPLAEKVANVERILFRTGPFRGYVPADLVEDGAGNPAGLDSEDRPGADEKVPACVYLLDNVVTRSF